MIAKDSSEFFESDFEDISNNNDRLKLLSAKQIALESKVQILEEKLKKAKSELLEFQTKTFPAFLDELGTDIDKIETEEFKIVRKTDIYVNESGTNRKRIADFLESHGASDLLKESIIIDDGNMQDIEEGLELLSIDYRKDSKFNVASVKAYIKSLRASGENINLSDLGMFEQIKTKVLMK
ncbi:MAG TPA: hypothetical protein VLB84_05835 [Bacteroidia bacterium]|nr:hypothetical protein [Bacteroidia bacterium]